MSNFLTRTAILLTIFTGVAHSTATAQTVQDNFHKYADALTLDISKKDGVFAKGEEITVYATSEVDTTATVRILRDAHFPEGSYNVKLQKGRKTGIFTKTYDRPIHIMLQVGSEDGKDSDQAGFIVAPEEFRTGYSHPKDFRKFWNRQKKAMRKTRLEYSLTPAQFADTSNAEKYECFDLKINMHEGRPVRGYMVYPKNTKKGSLPIVIRLHSAGVNRVFNYATPEYALSCARYGSGCIAIDINAHGLETGQPQSYYDRFDRGELRNYSNRFITGHGDYYFRLMFLRIVRTLDFACGLDLWDGKRVLVTGESQGGAQAFAVSGLDRRVTACVAIVPAMNDLGAKYDGRYGCWPKVLESSVNKGNEDTVNNILPYYDAAQFVKYSKAIFCVEAGLIDTTCPAAAVWAGINNIPGEKTVLSYFHRAHNNPVKSSRYRKDWEKINEARNSWINDYLK